MWIVVVCQDGLIACFRHKLTYNQLGGYDHSVLDTFVQLTEGRSARDQPKQPPAKKNTRQADVSHQELEEANGNTTTDLLL